MKPETWRILFATGEGRAQVISHAQDDANGTGCRAGRRRTKLAHASASGQGGYTGFTLHGEQRPNVMKRIVIVLLAAALCASCRSPAPNGIPNASDPPSVAGQYHFSTADLRIDLDIRPDGTYFASMNSWARVTEEHGVWGIEGDNVVLKCRSGGLQMPIRRLGPVRQRPAGMFQILEPDSQLGRAIIFSKS